MDGNEWTLMDVARIDMDGNEWTLMDMDLDRNGRTWVDMGRR